MKCEDNVLNNILGRYNDSKCRQRTCRSSGVTRGRGRRWSLTIRYARAKGFIKADVMAEFVRWMLILAVCWLQYFVVSWHRRCVIVVKIRDLIIERQKERFMRPTNAKQVVNGSIMAKVIKAIKCHANEVNEPQIIYLYILHDAHVCDIRYFVKKKVIVV